METCWPGIWRNYLYFEIADLPLLGLTSTWMHLLNLNQEGSKRRKSGEVLHSLKTLSLKPQPQQMGLKTQLVLALTMLEKMLQKKHSIDHGQGLRRGGGGHTRVTGRGGKSGKRRQKREKGKVKSISQQVWNQALADAAQALRGCNRFCLKEGCTFNLCLQNTFHHPLTITFSCVLKT